MKVEPECDHWKDVSWGVFVILMEVYILLLWVSSDSTSGSNYDNASNYNQLGVLGHGT